MAMVTNGLRRALPALRTALTRLAPGIASDRMTKAGVIAALLVVASFSPAAAVDLSPVNTFLTTIGTALTGTTGRAIGLIAVAAIGLTFLAGRMNWVFAGSSLLGLVILFGAGTILAGM